MYRDVAERAGRGEPATLDLLWPPFYAWFLIPFTKIGNGWPVAVAIVQMGLQGTSAILFRALLTQATGSARVAAIGQAFFLLDPHLAAFAHYLWPETLHVFLLIVFLWLVAVRPGRVWWLTAGITLGVLGLTKSFAQPFIPIVVLVLLRDLGWRQNIAQGVAIVALAFAIMLPTMVTNARREGVFIVADSSRFNLWVGLNQQGRRNVVDDIAGAEYLRYRASGDTFAERQRVLHERLSSFVADRGLAAIVRDQITKQYFRLFDHRKFLTEQLAGGPLPARGVGYVDADPRVSLLLRIWSVVVYATALTAAGPGLLATPLRRRPWLIVLFLLLAYGLCIFLGLEARSRFRLPLMLPVFAAAALSLARGKLRGAGAPRWRAAAGVVASIMLLLFAFGGDHLP
jgi:hypothetical protein